MNPNDVARTIAGRARARRLEQNLTQRGLAERAGVSLSSLKRFEQTGRIAFTSLLRVAIALDALDALEQWFAPPEFRSLDDALSRGQPRQRGRRS